MLRFPGQVADAATATHYNMARDYDPSLGRYLQSDPIGLAGGWNTYGYVGGNPVNRIDPEGLDYMARPDQWFTSGPFGIIAYVRDQVVPAMTGEKVCIDYDGMARDMLVTAGLGATGGILFKYGYDALRGFGPALLRKGSNVGKRGGAQGSAALEGAQSLTNEIRILRDAAAGKGNFSLGSSTAPVAARLGKAWVGKGYTIASDGKTLISSNGLRQFRSPSFKPRLGIMQANFEQRFQPTGQWQSNGHLDILK